MSTKRSDDKEFLATRKYIEVSNGDSIRIVREMQELSRAQLAELTGISTTTLVAIEKDEIEPDGRLVKLLAHYLRVPPTVLISGWRDEDSESAA